MKSIKKSSKLPVQAAPVERNVTGASLSSENGVEASNFLQTIGHILGGLI